MMGSMASQQATKCLAATDSQTDIRDKFGSKALAVWKSLDYPPQLSKTKSENDVEAVEGWLSRENRASSVVIRDYAFDFQAAKIGTVDFPEAITLENCSLVAGRAVFYTGALKAAGNGVTVTALGHDAIAVASAEGAKAKALCGNRSTLIATCGGTTLCGFAEDVSLYIAAKAVKLYVNNDKCTIHFPAVAPDGVVSVDTNVDCQDWQNWLQKLKWETVSVKELKEAMDASGEARSNAMNMNKWVQLVRTWEVEEISIDEKMDSAKAPQEKWCQIIAMFKKV